ncbi:MAG TPA: GAF domain-containing SpoIIE family protein phosphatase [Bacteroidota bacterium]
MHVSVDPSQKTLQEENQRLKRAVEELSILNDLARAIGASLNTQEIIQTIVRRSLRAINAEQGVITLVDEQQQGTMKTLMRTMENSGDHEQFHFDQALLGWMHLNKKPLVMNDTKHDERFPDVPWSDSIRSLISVPMMVKSGLRGVLTVYNKKADALFSDDDQRLLAIIASQSAQVVENARLNEQEQTLILMQEEVRLASRIQTELLPKQPPKIQGYDIAGKAVPAQTVGGDYFDFIPIDEHRIAVCLGDVSGKGLPASLLMANLQATLRGQTLSNISAKDCLSRSNGLLYRCTSPEKFATVFYGILDVQSHTLSFSNAGHDNPFVLSARGEPVRLKVGGIPLAMFGEFQYEEGMIALELGDTVVIYSDGIPEAMNANDDFFSERGVEAVLKEHWHLPANELMDQLMRAAKVHAGNTPQSDDMTMIVVKRLSDVL